MNLLEIGNKVSFREDIHQYMNEKGQVLPSVTTILHLFQEPFDPTGIIAYKCAQREGISKEQIQARWKKTADDACEYGTNIHGQIENYIKTGEIKNTPEKEIVISFSKIKFSGEIFSELRLKSDKYLLAGTADRVILNKNKTQIYDIKTNREFNLKSKYNKRLLYPLNHLSDCHINTYSLQILIYGEMLKEHGYDFEPGQILWVDRETSKIKKFDVLDLSKEVKDLLSHYLSIQEF